MFVLLKINKRKTKTGATVTNIVTPSHNIFCFSQTLSQSRSNASLFRSQPSLSTSRFSPSRNRSSSLSRLSHYLTTVPKKNANLWFQREDRVKISPSAVTTALVMLKSHSFASSIQVCFCRFLGLGFRFSDFVFFCRPHLSPFIFCS